MNSFGCNNCTYLKGNRCKLWEVKVTNPVNSNCESGHNGNYQRKDIQPIR